MAINKPTEVYLPAPSQKGGMSLAEAIARRKSVRHLAPHPISQLQLSQILWSAQGTGGTSRRYRTVPSAGATYPLEIFVVCGSNCIEQIDEGVYQYKTDGHFLALHLKGDVRPPLSRAALDQEFIYEAPVDIVICAVYERTTRRYGDRGERYVHIEVGHAGQNIYLEAAALGLATVAVGAFHDELVREVLRLDEQRHPLYIMPVGKPV